MNQYSLPLKFSREVKTGIFAVVSILLFIFGYNFLKGSNLFLEVRTFHVYYENVEGLETSAPVTINGLNVGKVQQIDFADARGKLKVSFTVDKDFAFSKKSTVRLYSSSLIGGKSLGIIPEMSSSDMAISGDVLMGEVELGMLETVTGGIKPLEEKVVKALDGLDTLLININSLLDEQTRGDLKNAIANLNQTMVSFKGASNSLNAMLNENKGKLKSTFANLDITAENFAQLSDSLSKLEVGKMTQELEQVVSGFKGIVSKMNNGEGSIGKLLKDEELYDNLAGASKELENLLEDMKLNPKRYVHFSLFGKKAKPYSPDDTND